MAKDPAVLLYTGDFLTGMTLLNYEQRGQYITLLCQQHQLGHLPFNHMISVCGSVDSVVINKFKKDEDGLYYNERMESESSKRVSYCKSRSNNKSGRKKNKSYDKSCDNHMSVHMENENENENKDINRNEDEDKKKKGKRFVIPTIKEIAGYCKERNNSINAETFHSWYESNGWKVGKNKMKNWKAAVITWENKNNNNSRTPFKSFGRQEVDIDRIKRNGEIALENMRRKEEFKNES